MPRLVDANDLLMDNSWAFYDENGNRNAACIAVENAPTVDAEPVVRCKDCKWWKTISFWEGHEHKVCVVESHESSRNAEDFCSRGERRNDARG